MTGIFLELDFTYATSLMYFLQETEHCKLGGKIIIVDVMVTLLQNCGGPHVNTAARIYQTVRAGTHYPHVTWAHVMLGVQLGCERRFDIEFYDADSHFCHSAYVTWSHVELWSAHAPARLSHFCCRTHFVRRAGAWADQSSTRDHVM